MEKERIVYHIDVNSAFLSWEAVYRIREKKDVIDLREIPSIIGGDQKQRHGIVLAKSEMAKQFGIKTGEPIKDALKKCPDLVICPPRRDWYEQCSINMRKEFQKYTPTVEKYSIDECFLDMTETIHLFGNPVKTAIQLKNEIREKLGFTVNIGVAPNKLLAKMASDFRKPDCVDTLYYDEIKKKMWPLSIGELFLVGRAARQKFQNLGIDTIGQLAKFDLNLLKKHFGEKYAVQIYRYANGIDDSPVKEQADKNKGYGNSITISHDVEKAGEAYEYLLALSEKVAYRLRKDGVKAGCICVEFKTANFRRYSHQKTLNEATDITNVIYQAAMKLFDESWHHEPIRLLGVRADALTEGEYQLQLFEDDKKEKLQKVDAAMDQIRGKYGNGAIQRGTFLNQKMKCTDRKNSKS